MAVDQFGNILSPEEEERQRRHAEAMGLLPPALRIQMTSPFGGGIGPQLNQYQGMTGSSRVPHHSQPGGYFEQNITPIPTDVTVDPTMAGMAGVTQDYGPFSRSLGALSGMLAPAPSSSLPSYFDDPVVNEDMERVMAEEAATKVDDFAMLASQDPVASLGGWVKDVTKTVELPDIVEEKQTYAPMPTLPMENVVPQVGFTQAGFTTGGANTGGPGNIDHLGNVFEVQDRSLFDEGDFILPSYRGLPAAAIPALGTVLAPALGPALGLGLTAGAITAAIAGEGPQPGEPYSGMGDPSDAFSTGHPGMMGATGYDLSGADIEPSVDVQSQVDTFAGMGAVPDMTVASLDDWGSVEDIYAPDVIDHAKEKGWVDPSGFMRFFLDPLKDLNIVPLDDFHSMIPQVISTATASDEVPGPTQEEIDVIIEKAIAAPKGNLERIAASRAEQQAAAAAVDTFEDIPAAPAKPAGPTPAEIAAANAASRASTRAAAKAAAAAQRKSDLAAQKAAARRTALARQALKDSQAAAARAVAASAAQAKSAQKAAKAVLSRMGNDRNRPSDREIAAAIEVMSQVDSFGSGGQRGFMGAEIGREDGGGFTGGDFSGGAGWE